MNPKPEVCRNRRIRIDGSEEVFALVVRTWHGDTVATTAVHRQEFDHRIGGARFVLPEQLKRGDALTEVGHLASAMTDKCAVSAIPVDGQKSVIVTTQDVLDNEDRKV